MSMPLSETSPQPFQPTKEIETPALVVDLNAMERNVADYAKFADDHSVALRSHAKTHKVPALAHYQDQVTDGGIVCQTLGEAVVMAQSGISDIYLSHVVVQPSKLNRLVWLSERLDAFATTVDGPENVRLLGAVAAERDATVDAVLEIDLGYERTGVASADYAVDLAEAICENPNLRFAGVMAFEAHVKARADSKGDYERLCAEAMDDLAAVVDRIEAAGVAVDEVKVGGTATSKFSGRHPIVTEINPGMYVFNDVGELRERSYELGVEDCALRVLSTVVSKPAADRVVVNTGSKAIARDSSRAPLTPAYDGLTYDRSSEEHGWIDVSHCDADLEVGDRIEWIPPHVCTTVNLYDTMIGVRDGRVENVWEIGARGKH